MDFKRIDVANGKALDHWLTWFNRYHNGTRKKSEHHASWNDSGPVTDENILIFENGDDRAIGMTHLDGRCIFYG